MRSCLILSIARLPGWYAPSSRFATTPSRPAPSNRSNQSAASARSCVAGVRWTGGVTAPSTASRRARRSPWGTRAEVLVAQRQQVPRDVRRRHFRRQHAHSRLGGVDAQQQLLEVESSVVRDHDLAVEHAAIRELRLERLGQLGEVAVERLEVAALRVDLVAVAEDQGPEAVPLRLVQPALALGQGVARLREHRLERRFEGESHARHDSAPGSPAGALAGCHRTTGGQPPATLWSPRPMRSVGPNRARHEVTSNASVLTAEPRAPHGRRRGRRLRGGGVQRQ